MPPPVMVSVQLSDDDELECLPYPTCYAPFVVVRVGEAVSLHMRDVATVEALACVVAEAHQALLEMEARAAATASSNVSSTGLSR